MDALLTGGYETKLAAEAYAAHRTQDINRSSPEQGAEASSADVSRTDSVQISSVQVSQSGQQEEPPRFDSDKRVREIIANVKKAKIDENDKRAILGFVEGTVKSATEEEQEKYAEMIDKNLTVKEAVYREKSREGIFRDIAKFVGDVSLN